MEISAQTGSVLSGNQQGEFLIILVDRDFPYSKPQAFIENFDEKRPKPHVEPMPKFESIARLCLQTPAIPSDPVAAVASAFADARELLKTNDIGAEEHDFEDDFGAYWSHYHPVDIREAKLHGLFKVTAGFGAFIYRSGAYYCFPDKVSIRRWHAHSTGAYVRDPLRFPIIEMTRLPTPDRYPRDVSSLLTLLRRYTADGTAVVGDMLRKCPARLPIVLAGTKPDNEKVHVALELIIRRDIKGRPLSRAHMQSKLADRHVFALYDVAPLNTRRLDAALSRLPSPTAEPVERKVAIIGCGALGSGIAIMLAKAGVSRLVLVDPDVLDWENIRRHELGAEWVGFPKSKAVKVRIERSLPDVKQVDAYTYGIQTLLGTQPTLLDEVDLIIAATGDWGADVFISDYVARLKQSPPVLYTWIEAYALAGHSVVISGNKGRFTDGFDLVGNFKGKASLAGLKAPVECGNTTSPFGVIELTQSQALAGRLALETLAGRHHGDVWRTWTTEESVIQYAEGSWTEYWLEMHGQPPVLGGVSEGLWNFL